MPMKTLAFLLMALAVLLAIIAGSFGIGYKLGQNSSSSSLTGISQKEAAKLEPAVVNSVSARIKEIGPDYLVVEAVIMNTNPLIEPRRLTRKAMINSQTKILRQRPKEMVEIKAGVDPFVTETIKKSDLMVDSLVAISSGENIKEKEVFTASRVVLIMTP